MASVIGEHIKLWRRTCRCVPSSGNMRRKSICRGVANIWSNCHLWRSPVGSSCASRLEGDPQTCIAEGAGGGHGATADYDRACSCRPCAASARSADHGRCKWPLLFAAVATSGSGAGPLPIFAAWAAFTCSSGMPSTRRCVDRITNPPFDNAARPSGGPLPAIAAGPTVCSSRGKSRVARRNLPREGRLERRGWRLEQSTKVACRSGNHLSRLAKRSILTLDPSPPSSGHGLLPASAGINKNPNFEVENSRLRAIGSVSFFGSKRDMGAEYFVRTLARRLDIPASEIGTAGLKDRHAVTRQLVSVPESVEARLAQADGEGIRVLKVSRHTNKLRAGHLRGNRFGIVVRSVSADASANLDPLLSELRRQGLPNYYGPQRFGKDGETVALGLALLRGERTAGVRPSPFLRRLALSAAQSLLFNDWLAKRLHDGLLGRVLQGDVMTKIPHGGLFVAEDVAAEQTRFDRREIVFTGPMYGRKLFASAAVAHERENAILQEAALELRHFFGFGKLLGALCRVYR